LRTFTGTSPDVRHAAQLDRIVQIAHPVHEAEISACCPRRCGRRRTADVALLHVAPVGDRPHELLIHVREHAVAGDPSLRPSSDATNRSDVLELPVFTILEAQPTF